MAEKLTAKEAKVIRGITDRGFAVIIWTPDELGSVDPERMEELSIDYGWSVINSE